MTDVLVCEMRCCLLMTPPAFCSLQWTIDRFEQNAGGISQALVEPFSPPSLPTRTLTTWTVSTSSPWKLATTSSLTSRHCRIVELTFHDFAIGRKDNYDCSGAYVRVYDGDSVDVDHSPVLATWASFGCKVIYIYCMLLPFLHFLSFCCLSILLIHVFVLENPRY